MIDTTQKQIRDLAANELSHESPLRMPLIRRSLSDHLIRLSPRAVDNRWARMISLPSAAGFNPYDMKIFIAHNSVVFDWIKNPAQSGRAFNEKDLLIEQLLLIVHDYLHCWAVRAIRQIMPALQFGSGEITEKNFEDMVFCHLLTEAVAVIGMDYWFLSIHDINDIIPIGTHASHFASSYKKRNINAFRYYSPGFDPYRPEFLWELTKNYCRGDFAGFSLDKIKESPLVFSAIDHEISYSHLQRLYTRRLISGFGGIYDHYRLSSLADELKKSVPWEEPWKQELTRQVGEMLWRLSVEDQDNLPAHAIENTWVSKKNHLMYTNIYSLSEEQLQTELADMEWNEDKHWFWVQYISTFSYDQFTRLEAEKIKLGLFIKNQSRLLEVIEGKSRLQLDTYEPKTLFVPN